MEDTGKKTFTLIIEPVSQCNLNCLYCFSDNSVAEVMSLETLEASFRRVEDYVQEVGCTAIQLLYHGGEPLLAGIGFFRAAAQLTKGYFPRCDIHHFVQSNGLQLTKEYCDFFHEHGFQVGLSLDGPPEIHNAHRCFANGKGSQRVVVEQLNLAKENRLGLGCNAVITHKNLDREKELYSYFKNMGVGFRANPVIPAVRKEYDDSYLLYSGEYGEILCRLFDIWVMDEGHRVPISPLDIYLKAIVDNAPQECQQQVSCVGSHLSIKPSGNAVLCSKFTGNILGNVHEHGLKEMFQTAFCREINDRPGRLITCHSCENWSICHGGCPHNALVLYNNHMVKDYFCKDYMHIFYTLRTALAKLTEEKKAETSV